MALSNDYPATAIAGIFGATQEARAAKEAMRILNEGRQLAFNEAAKFGKEAEQFLTDFRTQYGQDRTMLQKIMAETEAMDLGDGLSGADRIAFGDAAKLMNENLASTGNLRSGAAAYANAELTKRVVANAQDRRFGRQLNKLQLLFGGQATGGAQTGMIGQAGMGMRQLQTNLFQSGLNLTQQLAGAEIRKGAALSNQIVSVGAATDEVAHTVIDAFAAYASGGMSEMGGAMGGGGGGGGAKQTWAQKQPMPY